MARFLHIASGSAHELEYHLLLAKEFGYLKPEEHEKISNQVGEIKRMLPGFIQKIKEEHPAK